MKYDELVSWIGTLTGGVFTAVQTSEVFQIVSLVITCLAGLFTIVYTIWKWYRRAKADGKITEDEVDELMDELKDKIPNDKKK